mgnify:FL=1
MKSVSKLLTASTVGVDRLIARVDALNQLSETLRDYLGLPLGEHVYVANVRQDILVIASSSSAWLAKARFQAPAILRYMRQEAGLTQVKRLKFSVIASQHPLPTNSNRRIANHPGDKVLEQCATGISDPKLKSALKRLARHRLYKA